MRPAGVSAFLQGTARWPARGPMCPKHCSEPRLPPQPSWSLNQSTYSVITNSHLTYKKEKTWHNTPTSRAPDRPGSSSLWQGLVYTRFTLRSLFSPILGSLFGFSQVFGHLTLLWMYTSKPQGNLEPMVDSMSCFPAETHD